MIVKLISMQQSFSHSSPSVTEWPQIHHESRIRGLGGQGVRDVVMSDLHPFQKHLLPTVKSFWKSTIKCDGWISNWCSHMLNWDLNHHQLRSHGKKEWFTNHTWTRMKICSHIHTNFIDIKVSEAHLGLKPNYKLVWVNSNGEWKWKAYCTPLF